MAKQDKGTGSNQRPKTNHQPHEGIVKGSVPSMKNPPPPPPEKKD